MKTVTSFNMQMDWSDYRVKVSHRFPENIENTFQFVGKQKSPGECVTTVVMAEFCFLQYAVKELRGRSAKH